MKNKIKIFAIGIILLNGISSFAQLIINVGAGYGMASSPKLIGSNISLSSLGSISYSTGVYGSFGEGINFRLGTGYSVNEYLVPGINFGLVMGKKITLTNYYDPHGPITQTFKGSMISISPNITVRSGSQGSYVYARAGIFIPVSSSIKSTYHEYWSLDKDTYTKDTKTTTKGSISLGWNGALGVNFKLNGILGIFTELNNNNISIVKHTSEITAFNSSYKYGGGGGTTTITLSDLDPIDIFTDYVDVVSSNDNRSSNLPKKSLKDFAPFGSWGLNVGLHINL